MLTLTGVRPARGGGVDPLEHARDGEVDVVHRAEDLVVERVEADGDAPQARRRAAPAAFCASSEPFVVSVRSRPSIAASISISRSRSRRTSGSPPVIRIFSTPWRDERAREPLDLLERQQLAPVEEPVVAAEDLLRHAVDAAEVAAVGDRDAQVADRAAERVDEAHAEKAVASRRSGATAAASLSAAPSQ